MSNIRLDFPVWVQHKSDSYILRPLFMPAFSVADERYETAVKKLTQSIRKDFSQFKANRLNVNYLLWLLYNPQDLHFEAVPMDFNYGQRYFSGKISVAWFEHQKLTYVLLPAFDNYFFITAKAEPKRSEIIEEIEKQIQVFARKYRKDTDEELILNEKYTSGKGEFCANLDMNLFITGEKMSLEGEGNDEDFRQFFRTDITFEGRFEVQKVGAELNEMYPSELNRAYFADKTVEMLSRLIYNRENVPLVILGKRKSGKTTLLHETVFRYLEQNSDKNQNHLDNIWTIDPSRLIAGMSIVGMWQRRFESIIAFAMNPLDKNPRQDKLYFNNIVALFRIGKSSQNSLTLSDVMKPYMAERKLQIILEATPEEWDVVSEMDRGFADLFKVVRLPEISLETTLKIAARLRNELEYRHRFQITNPALVRLIELQKRFHKNEILIGAIAENISQMATKFSNQSIDIQIIIEEFSNRTHLNERLANQDIKITKNEFHEQLASKLIGQPDAVNCLAETLHTLKAQLNNPDKPFGSFLFIGPTGVGKTQAAKILAKYLFTHDESLVRFDMNEYIDSQAVRRLVGDFENPEGQLTAKIRFNSFCVLLFDEIEKAHPDVHNLLLQVLGEGRLTDALGRTVSFCNTVIIMTSNLGAERVGKSINLQRRDDFTAGTYEKAVKDFFRPEFINRIDKTLIFNKLAAKHISVIAGLQIKELLKRHGFLRRHTILNVSPEVLESIAENGFDPEMGGRALKRQIEKELTALIAEQLVEIAPNHPVIFNLYLENGLLKPFLVSLEHIPANENPAFPDFDGIEISAKHFENLLQEVEYLKEDLADLEGETSGLVYSTENKESDDKLLALKGQLNETEDKLRNILWEYKTGRKFLKPLTKNVSKVKIIRNYDFGTNPEKFFFDNLYQQLKIEDYFSEVYDSSQRIVNDSQALFFDLHQSVAWLHFYFYNYVDFGVDNILVSITSAVENAGQKEVEFLKKTYSRLRGPEKEFVRQKNSVFLHFRGVGLYALFEQEIGFHLFFQPHESSLPVEVKLFELEAETDVKQFVDDLQKKKQVFPEETTEKKAVKHILRLYSLPDKVKTDFLITDLRTGIIHNKELTEKDLQLLFYANFSEDLKFFPME